jgi:HSP20 family protein
MAVESKPSVPAKTPERQLDRWDPIEMLNELQAEMARRWGQGWPFGPWSLGRRLAERAPLSTAWAPRMDVYEQGGDLVVKAELPGVKKDDMEVTLDDGDLVIRGERKAEKEVKEESFYRMERSYGSFYRRLPLSFEVKPDQIKASCADGVLEIRIPKPAEQRPQPQKIKVS